jgi:hypothetical protein
VAKYHINYKGDVGLCKAKHSCPFGDMEDDHFSTPEAARSAYEEAHVIFNDPAVKAANTLSSSALVDAAKEERALNGEYDSEVESFGRYQIEEDDEIADLWWVTTQEEGAIENYPNKDLARQYAQRYADADDRNNEPKILRKYARELRVGDVITDEYDGGQSGSAMTIKRIQPLPDSGNSNIIFTDDTSMFLDNVGRVNVIDTTSASGANSIAFKDPKQNAVFAETYKLQEGDHEFKAGDDVIELDGSVGGVGQEVRLGARREAGQITRAVRHYDGDKSIWVTFADGSDRVVSELEISAWA